MSKKRKKKARAQAKTLSESAIRDRKSKKAVNTLKTGKTIWIGSPTEPFLDKYSRGCRLGEPDQFGITYKCWKREDSEQKSGNEKSGSPPDDKKCVAVKHMHKTRYYRIAEKYRKKVLQNMQDEITILKTFKHKHVVQLLDIYEDRTTLYLVMELCTGGELFSTLSQRKHYNEQDAARIAKQLFEALSYMEDVQQIAHCDLKPQNILFANESKDKESHVKVCTLYNVYLQIILNLTIMPLCQIIDFGMSKVLPRLQFLTHLCGTRMYNTSFDFVS